MNSIQKQSTTDVGHRKQTVCVVEDNLILLNRLREILSLEYNVVTASNGFDAYNYIKESKPDLILSDIMMPELDGMQLIKILKSDKKYAQTPVIFLSALDTEDHIVKGYENGAVDYVVKPFSMKVLLTKINFFLHNKKGVTTNESIDLNDPFLTKLNNYITGHIHEKSIYIGTVAEHFSLTTQQLRRRILKSSGKNFTHYVLDFRLEYAKKIILLNTSTIKEVAIASGFNYESYFIKVFKKRYGITPMKMRNKLNSSNN
jgi:YesN/AraC family two-component response regulator